MSEKKINICDVCDKEIAISKCVICGNDVCDSCLSKIVFSINTETTIKNKIIKRSGHFDFLRNPLKDRILERNINIPACKNYRVKVDNIIKNLHNVSDKDISERLFKLLIEISTLEEL